MEDAGATIPLRLTSRVHGTHLVERLVLIHYSLLQRAHRRGVAHSGLAGLTSIPYGLREDFLLNNQPVKVVLVVVDLHGPPRVSADVFEDGPRKLPPLIPFQRRFLAPSDFLIFFGPERRLLKLLDQSQ